MYSDMEVLSLSCSCLNNLWCNPQISFAVMAGNGSIGSNHVLRVAAFSLMYVRQFDSKSSLSFFHSSLTKPDREGKTVAYWLQKSLMKVSSAPATTVSSLNELYKV